MGLPAHRHPVACQPNLPQGAGQGKYLTAILLAEIIPHQNTVIVAADIAGSTQQNESALVMMTVVPLHHTICAVYIHIIALPVTTNQSITKGFVAAHNRSLGIVRPDTGISGVTGKAAAGNGIALQHRVVCTRLEDPVAAAPGNVIVTDENIPGRSIGLIRPINASTVAIYR